MFDQSIIDSAWGGTAQPAGSPPMRPVAQTKKKKNFFVDNISTVGGIAGGIGGGALGLMAGGFGAIPGAAIGSGLGSGLGETLENAITGDKLTNNVGKEAALGTLFGAGPVRGAKFAIGAAKGIAQGGGKAAVRQASDDAAKFTLRGAAGKALTGKASDLSTKQFGLQGGFISKYTKDLKEDPGKTLTRYGITSIDDVNTQISKQQDVFDTLVESAGNIKKSKIQTKFDSLAADLSKLGVPADKAMGQKIVQETSELLAQYGDEIPAPVLNNIKARYDKLAKQSLGQDAALSNLQKRVATGFREIIQEGTGSPQLKQTGKELQKLRLLQDEINKRAPTVADRNSSPLGLRNMLGGVIGGGGIGAATGGIPGAILGAGTVAAINSPAGRRIATQGAIKGGEKLIKSGENASDALGIAGRLGGLGLARTSQGAEATGMGLEEAVIQDQFQSDGSMNSNVNPMSDPNTTANNMNESYQNAPVSSSPYSRENLMADIRRDPRNMDKYIGYYSQLEEIFNPKTDETKLNSTQMQQANTAQSGMDSLETIGNTLRSSPNASKFAALPGGSFTQKLTGTGAYSAATANAVDAIGRLRSGGAINADEEKRFKTLLPAAFDDQATVEYKLNALNNIFSRFSNPQASGSLEDSLIGQQGAF